MSTSTSSLSIRTTWPVTTSPSSIGLEGRVVVGDDLPVDFEQEPVRPLDHAGPAGFSISVCTGRSVAQRRIIADRARCLSERRSGERERTRLAARLRRARLRRELRRAGGRARAGRLGRARADHRPLRARRAPDLGLRDADRRGWRRSTCWARCARASTSCVVHTPLRHLALAAAVVVLDVRLPRAVRAAVGAGRRARRSSSRPPRSPGRDGLHRAHRPRRAARAADRRRARLAARALQRDADPAARTPASRAASRSTPPGAARRWSCGSTPATSAPATRWSFPRRRRAARRRRLVLAARTTSRSRPSRLAARPRPAAPSGYQGNWIPHQLRAAVEDGVFFVGDSAGHCLPLTAEGIRTALYFGLACGRELRAVLDGRAHARAGARALRRVLRRARAQIPLAARTCSARSGR